MNNYAQYSAPILAHICKKYNFEMPNNDALQNMIKGDPCCKGGVMRCGR